MRARLTTVFACQSCGAVSPKWLGRCPECGEWNTYVEEVRSERPAAAPAPASQAISDVAAGVEDRISTGLPGLDRVLGGGLVPGSVVLLGGEPGIGKSTLLLQAARSIAAAAEVLYVSGEESASQVRLRGDRLEIREPRLFLLAETDVARIVAQAEARPPKVLVIDSIQAVRDSALTSGAGTVSQVRETAGALQRYAKARAVPVVLIGHVTKDGSLAGPKSLEHLVDAVLTVEGDRGGGRRLLRANKNRFGPVDELALYEMTGQGLVEIPNPSARFLSERRRGVPGSAVTAAREGSRSLLVEIQALVGSQSAGSPRRVAIGLDPSRLALLLAVLEGAGYLFDLERSVRVLRGRPRGLGAGRGSRGRRRARVVGARQGVAGRLGLVWRDRTAGRSADGDGGRLPSEGGRGSRLRGGVASGGQRGGGRRLSRSADSPGGSRRGLSQGHLNRPARKYLNRPAVRAN